MSEPNFEGRRLDEIAALAYQAGYRWPAIEAFIRELKRAIPKGEDNG